MDDMDIWTIAQLCRYLLLGASLVADQTDNQIILVL
jgi:hypothetical protein